eukprot:TRINITY_DN15087_c0_g1_i2.p1 TRINITY_DN15087_c0_g1~~TRINITY_DN15087_c0_g1_i2.p1  ORF type:complete len:266 (-),score=12.80 TRINITY_DN15087_c0_g1_i2:114-911(-)
MCIRDRSTWVLKFGFIYSGYKSAVYFWEFVIFFRKLLLIVIMVILCELPKAFISLTILFVIGMSYLLQNRNKPYLLEELNKLEELSLSSSAVIVFAISLFSTYSEEGNPAYINLVLAGCAILTLFSFLNFAFRWASLYIPELIERLQKGKGLYFFPGLLFKLVMKIVNKILQSRLYLKKSLIPANFVNITPESLEYPLNTNGHANPVVRIAKNSGMMELTPVDSSDKDINAKSAEQEKREAGLFVGKLTDSIKKVKESFQQLVQL